MRGSYTGSTTSTPCRSRALPIPGSPTIVIDTTPLASGHGIRGIGRYLDGVVSALAREEPAFVEARVRFLVAAGQDPPADALPSRPTTRARVRPQDLGWAVAAIADRRAARGLGRAWWHQTDPMLPWSPVPRSAHAGDRVRPDPPPRGGGLAGDPPAPATPLPGLPRGAAEGTRHRDDLDRYGRRPAAHARHPGRPHPRRAPGDRRAGRRASRPRSTPTPPSCSSWGSWTRTSGPSWPSRRSPPFAAGRRAPRSPSSGRRPRGAWPSCNDAPRPSAADAVAFRGPVPDDELVALYRRGVLLAVSRIEGFGLPPVEAILAGGRAVAVPTPDLSRGARGAATYAVSDQPAAIADAVKTR